MICGSGGSKSRLAKAAGAEPAGQRRDEKLHAVVARSTFPSQNVKNTRGADHFWHLRRRKSARRCGAKHISKLKTLGVRTTFGTWDVEIVHAVVARSTLPSQNVKNTRGADHFWHLRCRKSARRCGAKHISKLKTLGVRTTFGTWDVEKVHAVVARSTFPSQNVKNTRGADHFWQLRCRKSARRCGAKHISKSKCTKHTMYGPILEVQMSFRVAGARDCGPCQKWVKREGFVAFSITTTTTLHYTPIHYTTTTTTTTPSLHSTTLHSTPLHCTQLHSITLHYTTLHYTTLHYTTLHYTTLHYTTLHYITLHYTTFHYTTLHYTTLHYTTATPTTTLHYTSLHYTTLHSTTLRYTTLHYITLHYITLNDTAPQIDRQTDR